MSTDSWTLLGLIRLFRRTMTESLRVLEEVGSLRAIVSTLRMRECNVIQPRSRSTYEQKS